MEQQKQEIVWLGKHLDGELTIVKEPEESEDTVSLVCLIHSHLMIYRKTFREIPLPVTADIVSAVVEKLNRDYVCDVVNDRLAHGLTVH